MIRNDCKMTAQASTPWSEWWAMALDALTPPPASTPECKVSFPGSRTSSQMVRPLSDPCVFFFDMGTHLSKVSVEAATATATVMAEQVPLKAVQSSRTTIPTTIRSTRWHQILSSFEVYQRFVTENTFFLRTRPTTSAWLRGKPSRWPLLHSALRTPIDADGTIWWYSIIVDSDQYWHWHHCSLLFKDLCWALKSQIVDGNGNTILDKSCGSTMPYTGMTVTSQTNK